MPQWGRSCFAAAIALALFVASTASHAEGSYNWKAEPGEEHGSQVASSEGLPMILGGAAGGIAGALIGSAFDDHQPPTLGALIGAGVGGVAGVGGGAWLIRSLRDEDTRFAGALTGGATGLGIGCLLFNASLGSDSAANKVGGAIALVALPIMGAFGGRALAIDFGGDKSSVRPKPGFASIQPTIAPIAGFGARDWRPAGMSIGLSGSFF